MPVQDYGVVIGQYDHFDRDDANRYGNFFHGHIFVNAAGLSYNCAVDVKYPNGTVEYFKPGKLDDTKFTTVSGLADGFHSLASNTASGAIDYVRSPLISEALGCVATIYAWLNAFTGKNYQVWTNNVGMSALSDLEAFLAADGGIQRIYVFGARYRNQNQSVSVPCSSIPIWPMRRRASASTTTTWIRFRRSRRFCVSSWAFPEAANRMASAR